LIKEVLETLGTREQEVQDKRGSWYLLRVRPYRTLENAIDGAVAVMVNVGAMRRALEFAETVVSTMSHPILVLDEEIRVRMANQAFLETFKVTEDATRGQMFLELGNGQWDIPELRRLLEGILPGNTAFAGYPVEREFANIGRRMMLLSGRKFSPPGEEASSILLSIEDITERRRGEEVLAQRHAELQSQSEELNRFNRAAVGRELRMVGLKKEVNELLERQGLPSRYALDFEDEGRHTDVAPAKASEAATDEDV
jgi:two-component system CheB/CheR fusion protein